MSKNDWDDVFAPTETVVGKVLLEQFRELATVGIEYLGEGWDCVAYRCGPWVFRFPRRPMGVTTLSTEARALPQLGKEVLLGRESSEFPYPFLGTRYQPGIPLEEYRGSRAHLAKELGAYLADLHSTPIPPCVPPDPGKLDTTKRRALIEKHLGHVPEWVPTQQPVDKETVLLHGDLYCRHIYLSTEGHLEGLIDWGDLCRGHRSIDLACAWYFEAPDRKSFWNTYGAGSDEILTVSRFRALYHTLQVRNYARAKGFRAVLRETEETLKRILY